MSQMPKTPEELRAFLDQHLREKMHPNAMVELAGESPEERIGTKPVRIGVLLGDLGRFNTSALKYLIVHLNTLQRSFEFEVLPMDSRDPLRTLLSGRRRIDREQVRAQLFAFRERTQAFLLDITEQYQLAQRTIPQKFIVLTLSKFVDYFYGVSVPGVRVLALGDWNRHMAPPSLLEAFVTQTLRHAVGLVCPSLSRSVHLGTKGCMFDFTDSLDEARYKTLNGFICSECRAMFCNDGFGLQLDEIAQASDTSRWLGKSEDPATPAGIVAKLGYDLFLTRGVSPTVWQKVREALRDEAVKELIKVASALLIAALVVWFGLKTRS